VVSGVYHARIQVKLDELSHNLLTVKLVLNTHATIAVPPDWCVFLV